jgi:phenylacetic acid degradation operon negative regulatory protein
MHARSALFDVYGDHLADRGHVAPVAALVRLLEPVGIAAPAVRTAISRMVAQGWLEPVQLPGGRGYRATAHAVRRLADAGDRIYRRTDRTWDGRWHLALVDLPAARAARRRLRADLGFLGYAPLGDALWVSPFPRAELEEVVATAGGGLTTARVEQFDPPQAPGGAWDLDALGAAYDAWPATAAGDVAAHLDRHADEDEAAFAARFHLVHEWRKFLFADPGLPDELLPAGWPGHRAGGWFTAEAARLAPGAERFVARCLDGAADSGA